MSICHAEVPFQLQIDVSNIQAFQLKNLFQTGGMPQNDEEFLVLSFKLDGMTRVVGEIPESIYIKF